MKTLVQLVASLLFIGMIAFFAVHAYVYYSQKGKPTTFSYTTEPKALSQPCKFATSHQHCLELAQ